MKPRLFALVLSALAACSPGDAAVRAEPPAPPPAGLETAVFAGGCFWSSEKAFDGLRGVHSAVSGFIGGTLASPTYGEVVAGGTGHREAVQVTYDPAVVSYRALADRFWRTIDPTDPSGQFCDRGASYRTGIYASAAQRAEAQASLSRAQQALGRRRIVTPILPAARFWPAAPEHQDYARRHPVQYEAYRIGCRRSARLHAVWGDAAIG